MRQIILAVLLGSTLLAAGCVSTVENSTVPVVEVGAGNEQEARIQDNTVPVYETDKVYKPVKKAPVTSGNNAVTALIDLAEKQTLNGEYGAAAATLERAIRISPRDGALYYQLAQVRYLQTNYHQAEQLCRKAISLAGNDTALLASSRSLMAKAGQAAR